MVSIYFELLANHSFPSLKSDFLSIVQHGCIRHFGGLPNGSGLHNRCAGTILILALEIQETEGKFTTLADSDVSMGDGLVSLDTECFYSIVKFSSLCS
jgi:hypothetical protein